MILLNPGPVTLSSAVREAMTKPDLCHREVEFSDLQDSVRDMLLDVYALSPATWAAVLLAGSGTSAVEAMLISLVPNGARMLVVVNGVYGERMAEILRVHQISHQRLVYAWGEKIDPLDVEHELKADPSISRLVVVHHETTTGRLNDIAALGSLCKQHGVHMLVDGVSSYGAELLDFESWNIAGCAATANKCLHGAPGLSFVIVQRNALASACAVPRSVLLNLFADCQAQDKHSTRFTQPVHLFYALEQALAEFSEQGGWHARNVEYRLRAARVREGLQALGISPLLDAEDTSVVLASYYLLENIGYSALHDALKARGFIIYAGQGALQDKLFRISIMGEVTQKDIERLIDVFAQILSNPARASS